MSDLNSAGNPFTHLLGNVLSLGFQFQIEWVYINRKNSLPICLKFWREILLNQIYKYIYIYTFMSDELYFPENN